MAWLTADVLFRVVVEWRSTATSPRAASQLVVRTMVESFYRVEDLTRTYRAARRCGGVVVAGVRTAEPAR